MLVDVSQFPIIWMRAERAHYHDEDGEEKLMQDILQRNERFVMIADGMPSLDDMSEIRQGGRQKAMLFKKHGAEFRRLCAAMILVGKAAHMPVPIKKALEGITSTLGIKLIFAENLQTAIAQSHTLLGSSPSQT